MKPSFATQILFIILSFLTLSIIAQHSAPNPTETTIEGACALTRAPERCAALLRSDPRSASGDIRTFGLIVLERALAEVERVHGSKGKKLCPNNKWYRRLVPDILEGVEKLKSGAQPVAPAVDKMSNAVEDILSCGSFNSSSSRESSSGTSLVGLLRIAMDILLVLP
ncbi:unnamed protein product [Cuscuta campestris]|uniref:Pectinesterase inhibitor domain-containing protein n=2 Tax=Cuscuta sect. Cleistogrammica TaxID=1824901 RepID=A0A484N7X1_9ASTE|nr:hypothetical protein DM860_014903 [Cuscuta australis]VFQ97222.1 unnamed protein product [Cuscuta campestris]